MRIVDITTAATVAQAPQPGDSSAGVSIADAFLVHAHFPVDTDRFVYAYRAETALWHQVLADKNEKTTGATLLLHGFARVAAIAPLQMSKVVI